MRHGYVPRRLARRLIAPALLLALAATPAPAAAGNVGFVRTQGAQFTLNGAPFFFAGTNAFYLMVSAAWGSPNYTDDTLAIAAQLGFSVLRAWAFFDGPDPLALQPAPGVFNEASFRALDYVLFKADQAGVRLLLPLVNGHPAEFGGTAQYVAWCAPGQSMLAFYTHPACRQLYQNFVATLLTRVNTYTGRRYLDDPTVFAWELANEPELPDNLDPSGQGIRAWVAEMAAFIKTLDPHHLVGTGESGFDVSAAGYSPVGAAYGNQAWLFNGIKGVAFAQNSADPNIDFASVHLYTELWNLPPEAGSAWIADHARLARALGKPLVLGEFGHSQNAPPTYAAWLQTVDAEQVAGALVWQLMCPACFGMRDQFGVAYPPASPVSTLLAQAAATAAAKSAGPLGPPAPPASPGASALLSVVVRGVDDHVYHNRFDGARWSGWIGLGGATADTPALAVNGGMLELVVRGTDGGLYHTRFDGTRWRDWAGLGGGASAIPALVAHGGMLELVVRGTDDGIYHARFDGTRWHEWTKLPGATTAAPALVAHGESLELVVRGIDGSIWHNRFDGSGWLGWSPVPGATTDTPALAVTDGTVELVVRGTNGGIYHNRFVGAEWRGWSQLTGSALGAPVLAVSAGGLELVVRGKDGRIYHSRFVDAQWSSWTRILGLAAGTPSVAVNGGVLELLIRRADGTVRHERLVGASWLELSTLEGATPSRPAVAAY